MALSRQEQQRLDEIERTLSTESPQFTELFQPGVLHQRAQLREHWRRIGLITALASMAINIAGMSLNAAALIVVAAFLVTLSPLMTWFGPTLDKRYLRGPQVAD